MSVKAMMYTEISCDKRKRIEWVDIAKGITIVLMIIGHTGCPRIISSWIYSFHMPLFFILSGLTTNWGGHYLAFALKKIKSMLIPFLWYSFFMCVLLYLFGIEHPYSSLSNGWGAYALWFVPVLFVGLLISGLFLNVLMVTNNYFLFTIMALLSSASYAFCYYQIHLPWNMAVVFYASMFIILGAYLSRFLGVFSLNSIRMGFALILVTLSVTIIISHYWSLDMNCNHVLPMLPLTIAAIAGTFFISIVSMAIGKYTSHVSKILQTIGKETFLILAFSQIIIQIINKYLIINVVPKYILLVFVLLLMKVSKDRIACVWNKVVCRKN